MLIFWLILNWKPLLRSPDFVVKVFPSSKRTEERYTCIDPRSVWPTDGRPHGVTAVRRANSTEPAQLWPSNDCGVLHWAACQFQGSKSAHGCVVSNLSVPSAPYCRQWKRRFDIWQLTQSDPDPGLHQMQYNDKVPESESDCCEMQWQLFHLYLSFTHFRVGIDNIWQLAESDPDYNESDSSNKLKRIFGHYCELWWPLVDLFCFHKKCDREELTYGTVAKEWHPVAAKTQKKIQTCNEKCLTENICLFVMMWWV